MLPLVGNQQAKLYTDFLANIASATFFSLGEDYEKYLMHPIRGYCRAMDGVS